ncbi:MAG: GMC family oxidoreductase N-terminal domain-containing protein [Azoarcus sp.]|jgi:choline dehydrogenase|nr:GMC family oxidoreductase N-terminal domain-containing protein [Azoarcus sp.]
MSNPQFDYVIVGAGSAGCVLANRLTASGQYRVALIEAGGAGRHPFFHIPVGYVWNRAHPRGNWLYYTEAEASSGNRRILWPRGKVLGGSSAINGLLYVRGQARDYDEWRDMGNPGWGYEDVLPYFRKAEDQARGPDAWHGIDGPLAVTDLSDRHPLADAFLKASAEAGFPLRNDFNQAEQAGVGYFQQTVKNGIRWSTANAYLKPARKRPNLAVFTRAHALKLAFDGQRAAGVLIRHRGKDVTLMAARELIVSAGAVGTPAFLQHSGIGEAERLQKLGIAMHANLPGVGCGLQDHYMVSLTWRVKGVETFNESARGLKAAREALRYAFQRRGLLTASASQVNAFLPTAKNPEHPDIQFHVMMGTFNFETGAIDRAPGMTCGVCQLRPESRGEIFIDTADPFVHPRIRPNYLSAPNDAAALLEGLRLARKAAEQTSLARCLAEEILPGAKAENDDALLAFARNTGKTLYHPASTCKMGAGADAVVDSQLRVHGVPGLRVVDASIMPTLVSGNTNAPTIMIAEKAAALILGR